MSTSTHSTTILTKDTTSGTTSTSTEMTTSGSTRWTTNMTTSYTTSPTSSSIPNQTTSTPSYTTVYSSTIPESANDNTDVIAGATVGTFLALLVLVTAGLCWWKRGALSTAISNIRSRRAMDKSVRSGAANEYVEAADVQSGEPRHNPVTRLATPAISADVRYYVNIPEPNGNLVYETVDKEFTFNDIEEGRRGVSLERPTCASKGYVRLDDNKEYKGSEESLYSNVVYSGVTETVDSAILLSKNEPDYCEIINRDSASGLENRDRDIKCDSYIQCDSFARRDADIDIPDQTALVIPDTQCELTSSDYLSLCGETLSLYSERTNSVSCLSTDDHKVLESKSLNEYEVIADELSNSTEVLVNKQADSNGNMSCGLTHLLEILSNKSIHLNDVLELTHSNDSAHQNIIKSNESAHSTEVLFNNDHNHSTEDATNVTNLSTELLSSESSHQNEVLYNESSQTCELLSNESTHSSDI